MAEKFIDGTDVPPGYHAALAQALNDCCDAEELFDLDELEDHARRTQAEEDARRDLDEAKKNHQGT